MAKLAAFCAIAILAACLLAGCGSDDSMSGSVKANPAMANRYEKKGDAAPKGVAPPTTTK